MRIPSVDPVRRYAYTTSQAINALQIGSGTWYTYSKRLGLTGKKRNASCAIWWTYDQVAMVFEAICMERMRRGTF